MLPHFQMINYPHLCGNIILLHLNYNFCDVTSIVTLRIVTSHDFEFRKRHLRLFAVYCDRHLVTVPSSIPCSVHKKGTNALSSTRKSHFSSGFPTKTCHHFSYLPCLPHIILQFINPMTLNTTKYNDHYCAFFSILLLLPSSNKLREQILGTVKI
jgi:hypothetical protein